METVGRVLGGTIIMGGGILGVLAGAETFHNAEENRNRDPNVVSGTFDGLADAAGVVEDVARDYYNQARFRPNNGPTDIPAEAILGVGEMVLGLAITSYGGYMARTGWANRRARRM